MNVLSHQRDVLSNQKHQQYPVLEQYQLLSSVSCRLITCNVDTGTPLDIANCWLGTAPKSTKIFWDSDEELAVDASQGL